MIVCIWSIIVLYNYYIALYITSELITLLLLLFLLSMTINQFIKTFRERKSLSKIRIQKAVLYLTLFSLTLTSSFTIDRLIEYIDWRIFRACRENVVKEILENKLKPNIPDNSSLCELPYKFPPLSNNENIILIKRDNSKLTVTFFIENNFFDIPTPCFIYTTDSEIAQNFKELIKTNNKENWQLSENWYRITN